MTLEHIPDIGARHMAAVLSVAEYRSFVAAAAALRMSQPALTRSVQRVEDILGVQLFERSTRSVRLTTAGREFVAVAQRITNDLRITVESMREFAEQKRGQVILSTIMSVANGTLPLAVAAYRQISPGVEIHVRDGIHGSVIEDVKAGVADFGLNYLNDTPDGIVTERLGKGRFEIVVPDGHPFATAQNQMVELRQLVGMPLVSLPSDAQTRRILDTEAAVRGIKLSHRVIVSQIPTLLNFVRSGSGIAFVPSSALTGKREQGLVRLKLEKPSLSMDIGFVRLSERSLSPAASGLMQEIKNHWHDD